GGARRHRRRAAGVHHRGATGRDAERDQRAASGATDRERAGGRHRPGSGRRGGRRLRGRRRRVLTHRPAAIYDPPPTTTSGGGVTTIDGDDLDRSAEVLARLFDVRDLSAVVTGAASGLGFAMAEVLADCGARVTLADIDAGLLEESTSALAERGCRVRSAVVDVADAGQVQA